MNEQTDLEQSRQLPPPPGRKGTVLAVSGLAASALLSALMVLPPNFAITEPGPTYDTLGSIQDQPLVSISGAPSYPASGELRLTTVSVVDARENFGIGAVIQAYFSPSRKVIPAEQVYGTRDEDHAEVSKQQWISSQEAATVAALEQLGETIPATVTVATIAAESNANGVLEVGDVIVAVDGKELVTFGELGDAIAAHEAGEQIALTVERDGERVDVAFDLIKMEDGSTRIGIEVDPTFDLPIDVKVALDTVGGPSAGLMFALAIMDLLTEDDELGGAQVAGTGTIDVTGDVGPIGGIRHKMAGAAADGADIFLAPVENCSEVQGHIPDGLSVVAVDTLDDAYAAIVAIGRGELDDLPRCGESSDESGVKQ